VEPAYLAAIVCGVSSRVGGCSAKDDYRHITAHGDAGIDIEVLAGTIGGGSILRIVPIGGSVQVQLDGCSQLI
jgi:hypothetical protein